MKITVNNKDVILDDEITVSGLIGMLNESEHGTAIAINGKVVKKENWDTAKLQDNDKVLLIKAAYGG